MSFLMRLNIVNVYDKSKSFEKCRHGYDLVKMGKKILYKLNQNRGKTVSAWIAVQTPKDMKSVRHK